MNLKDSPEEKSLKISSQREIYTETTTRSKVIVVKRETRIEIRSETDSNTSCFSDIRFDFLAQPTVNCKFQEKSSAKRRIQSIKTKERI